MAQLYESVGTRDLIEIAILAIVIYSLLRLLGKTRGSVVIRGLGIVVVGIFFLAQVIIASFDLTELGQVLDYLLTTVLLGMVVIFQPELRRGLVVLGRYRMVRYLVGDKDSIADKLTLAAEAMSYESVGALIAVQRQTNLAAYAETGEVLDAEINVPLLRTIFNPRTPLHDGAVIIVDGRVRAAGCQLPLGQPPPGIGQHLGMRHRAALSLSDETDAVVLVVSEETGRISLAVGGRLEVVTRERLADRLAEVLSAPVISAQAA
jgi:diadenylate cyclase